MPGEHVGRDLDGYLDRQDDTVLIGTIIETAAAVGSIGEILDGPELGYAFIGHRGLTVSLGHRNDVAHPEVAESVERIRTACRDAGVPVGRVPGDPSAARAAIDAGFQLFLLGCGLDAVRNYFVDWIAELKTARTDG